MSNEDVADDVAEFLKVCTYEKYKNSEGHQLWVSYRLLGGNLGIVDFKKAMKAKGFTYKKVRVDGICKTGFQGVCFE